ncbi:MAG: S1 RNA-binding domain-containing protein [Tepidisphaerales bacterium]
MGDICHNCGELAAGQSTLRNWEAICSHCGQLLWLRRGDVVPCRVTLVARFGIIVALGDAVEGLVHVTELAEEPVGDPADVVAVGSIVRAKVLRIDQVERKIGLSIKRVAW